MSDPKNALWSESSIEFCGGTHLSNTKEAQHFILTEETAVAKGIRRISGITGESALEARALGDNLLAQAQSLGRLVLAEKDASESQVAEFEASITSIRYF